MSENPSRVIERVETVKDKWSSLRPAKSFYGMTLEGFNETAVKPCYDIDAEIADLQSRLQSALSRRRVVHANALECVRNVVNAVKADPEEGEDGDLYEALGYVPRALRARANPRRKRNGTVAPPSAEGPLNGIAEIVEQKSNGGG